MNERTWSDVDAYVSGLLIAPDAALSAALESSVAAGLPEIQVSAPFGKLLQMLARSHGARRILELGTLGGYSTIWLAGALPPEGRLTSIEFEPKHATVARANLARAGFADQVEIRVGAALEILPQLASEGAAPFDFIFIDADKDNYPGYFEWSLRLSRPGTVIVADNVVRNGAVIDPANPDPRVQGVRSMLEIMAREPRLETTVIQTVGCKGYDGFALAVVKA